MSRNMFDIINDTRNIVVHKHAEEITNVATLVYQLYNIPEVEVVKITKTENTFKFSITAAIPGGHKQLIIYDRNLKKIVG